MISNFFNGYSSITESPDFIEVCRCDVLQCFHFAGYSKPWKSQTDHLNWKNLRYLTWLVAFNRYAHENHWGKYEKENIHGFDFRLYLYPLFLMFYGYRGSKLGTSNTYQTLRLRYKPAKTSLQIQESPFQHFSKCSKYQELSVLKHTSVE